MLHRPYLLSRVYGVVALSDGTFIVGSTGFSSTQLTGEEEGLDRATEPLVRIGPGLEAPDSIGLFPGTDASWRAMTPSGWRSIRRAPLPARVTGRSSDTTASIEARPHRWLRATVPATLTRQIGPAGRFRRSTAPSAIDPELRDGPTHIPVPNDRPTGTARRRSGVGRPAPGGRAFGADAGMTTLPDTMRVVEAEGVGGPEVLVEGARPVPEPGPGDVLIRVTAAGVNGPDLVQRRGHYPPPEGASDLLGLEVSGEVVATGEDTTAWRPGDRVCALTNGGGYAEYVAVDAGHCLPIPEGVGEVDAAGLPETWFTVWSNLFHGPTVPEASTLLVHGGGGGIGSTAIQLGAARGLRVFTTVEAGDVEFVTSLGAERAIDFRTEDFVSVVRDAGGADLVLDIIGGDYIARNIKAARPDARIVQLAFNHGSKVEINLMPVMLKRLTYTGSTLRSRPAEFKAAIATELREEVWPLFADGTLRSVTHAVLPMARAGDAHRTMEDGQHRGKILLRP